MEKDMCRASELEYVGRTQQIAPSIAASNFVIDPRFGKL